MKRQPNDSTLSGVRGTPLPECRPFADREVTIDRLDIAEYN